MLDFEFGEHIGQGGMADVYMGFQRGMGGFEKLVVLKQILPSYAKSPVFRSMFVNEAKMAAAIRHPNVVETYHIHQSDERLFIAMEYIDGLTLLEILKSLGKEKMPIVIAARIVADLAAGVHAAHNLTATDGSITPIVHLDITPSNLMVSQNGIAKILDYGIAKAATGSDKESEFSGGKPGYIPPEYTAKGIIDPKGDIFQLGLVLHELLTGELLFDADSPTAAIVASETSPIVAPSAWRPEIPKALDDIVLTCLERNLKKRTASAKLLRQQLTTFLKSRGNPSSAEVAYWLQAQCYGNLQNKKSMETRVRRNSEQKRIARGTDPNSPKEFIAIRYENPTRSLRSKSELQHLLIEPQNAKANTKAKEARLSTTKDKTPKRLPLLLAVSAIAFLSLGAYLGIGHLKKKDNFLSNELNPLESLSEKNNEALAPPSKLAPIFSTKPHETSLKDNSPILEQSTNQKTEKRKNSKPRHSAHRIKPKSEQALLNGAKGDSTEPLPKTDLHDPWETSLE